MNLKGENPIAIKTGLSYRSKILRDELLRLHCADWLRIGVADPHWMIVGLSGGQSRGHDEIALMHRHLVKTFDVGHWTLWGLRRWKSRQNLHFRRKQLQRFHGGQSARNEKNWGLLKIDFTTLKVCRT